jgi:hypothetical protein
MVTLVEVAVTFLLAFVVTSAPIALIQLLLPARKF